MTKAVFIVGNKRSGSTQLMTLLNLHPNIFVSNESDIIWILYCFHNNLEIIPYQWDTPVGMNKALEQCQNLLSKDKTPFENFVTIQTQLMKAGFAKIKPANKENLLWIGDQKPFQQIDPKLMPFIKENFPGAKFLHLIRHPFPVVKSSQVFVGQLWKGMSDEEILKRWTMHEQWITQEKEKNEVPMLDVKYEDIISHTQREMVRMFDFLEVTYNENILKEARKITRSMIKLHPRLSCPPETQAIMEQYGYKTQSLWLENPLYINSFNFLKTIKKKLTGSW
ncbi:Sulfotransferase [Beggiatoa sp. PS]|nr:Sulfotransferase [Beggiatoa sp. PS]